MSKVKPPVSFKVMWARPNKKNFLDSSIYDWLDKITDEEYEKFAKNVRKMFSVDEYYSPVYAELRFQEILEVQTCIMQLRYDEYRKKKVRKLKSSNLVNRVISKKNNNG